MKERLRRTRKWPIDPHNNQFPVFQVAQQAEHCISIAEVRVRVSSTYLSGASTGQRYLSCACFLPVVVSVASAIFCSVIRPITVPLLRLKPYTDRSCFGSCVIFFTGVALITAKIIHWKLFQSTIHMNFMYSHHIYGYILPVIVKKHLAFNLFLKGSFEW